MKDSDGKKTDEANFRKESRDGKDMFICNVCNHETKTIRFREAFDII